MKKKVIRLNEGDIEKLVRKIIKESDLGWVKDFQSTGNVYLTMFYSNGDEDYGYGDYDTNQNYVNGLILSKIPRHRFIEIMGDSDIMEIDIYDDDSVELLDEMVGDYELSVNTSTKQEIIPNIQQGLTRGVITVNTEKRYNRLLSKYTNH